MCPKHIREDFFALKKGTAFRNAETMKKLFTMLAVAFLLTAFNPAIVDASSKIAGSSAGLTKSTLMQHDVEVDRRAEILEKYLESHNSPMAPHAQTFIDEADRYDLDWKWEVSIAGIESYYGQMIPPSSYNGWGFGVYGNNVRRFASWDEGIHVVSQALREDYMDANGLPSIQAIGSSYASEPNWSNKGTRFMNQLEVFEAKYSNKTIAIAL